MSNSKTNPFRIVRIAAGRYVVRNMVTANETVAIHSKAAANRILRALSR